MKDDPNERISFKEILKIVLNEENHLPKEESKFIENSIKESEIIDKAPKKKLKNFLKLCRLYLKITRFPEALNNAKYGKEILDHDQQKYKDHKYEGKYFREFGNIYMNLEDFKMSELNYLSSLRVFTQIFGEKHLKIAKILLLLGNLYMKISDFPRSLDILQKSLNIMNETHKENHRNYGSVLNALGMTFYYIGDYPKSEHCLLQALEFKKKILQADKSDQNMAPTFNNLGLLYTSMGLLGKAKEYFIYSIELFEFLYGKMHDSLGKTYNSLGMLHEDSGEYKESEKCYLKSLKIKKKIYGEKHLEIVNLFIHLGNFYMVSKINLKLAEEYTIKALEVSIKIMGKFNRQVGAALNNLGMIKFYNGNMEEAKELLLQSLEVKKNVFETEHPEMTFSLDFLGLICSDLGLFSECEKHLNKSLNIKEKFYGVSTSEALKTKSLLAWTYSRQREFKKAEDLCLEILKTKKKFLENEENASIGDVFLSLGNIYYEQRDFQKSEQFLFGALQIGKKINNFGLEYAAIYSLGLTFLQKGEYQKAKEFIETSLEKNMSLFGENSLTTAMSLDGLGNLYYRMLEFEKANEYCQKANTILKAICPKITYDRMVNEHNLGLINFKMGSFKEADQCYEDARCFPGNYFEHQTKENLTFFEGLSQFFEKKANIEKANQYKELFNKFAEKI